MGCEPDEMGIGPVYSVPKLLKNYNLSIDDIDIWELNEAFAVQVVYCRDKLGIPMDKLNLDGGSISIGHPFGMTGSRQVGHLTRQLNSLDKQFGVVTMCVGGVQIEWWLKFGWFQTCNFTFWRQVEMSWQLCIRGGVKAKVKVVTVHISCSLVNQLTGSYQLC